MPDLFHVQTIMQAPHLDAEAATSLIIRIERELANHGAQNIMTEATQSKQGRMPVQFSLEADDPAKAAAEGLAILEKALRAVAPDARVQTTGDLTIAERVFIVRAPFYLEVGEDVDWVLPYIDRLVSETNARSRRARLVPAEGDADFLVEIEIRAPDEATALARSNVLLKAAQRAMGEQ